MRRGKIRSDIEQYGNCYIVVNDYIIDERKGITPYIEHLSKYLPTISLPFLRAKYNHQIQYDIDRLCRIAQRSHYKVPVFVILDDDIRFSSLDQTTRTTLLSHIENCISKKHFYKVQRMSRSSLLRKVSSRKDDRIISNSLCRGNADTRCYTYDELFYGDIWKH